MFRPTFAGVRARKIKNWRELAKAAEHGRRTDSSSRRRIVEDRDGRQLAFSRYSPDDPFDLVAAHRARLAETGAAVVNGRAIGLHLICFVSPDVIRKAGGLHDPANPSNTILLMQAIAFCEHVFGEGSAIAARLDLDESGGAAADVFVVPVECLAVNQHTSRMRVSVETPLLRLQTFYGVERSFAAMQTAWAQYAKEHIDAGLQRGIPKTLTGRLHVYADVYRETVELATASAVERCEAVRSQLEQDFENERRQLHDEAVAAADVEARKIREAAEEKAAIEIAQGRARLRAETDAAATEAARKRDALERGRNVLIAEMQRVADASVAVERRVATRVDDALHALASGLAAYEQGQLMGVSDSREASGMKFLISEEVSEAGCDALRANLEPAWAAGLESALRTVHMAREAAIRGEGGLEETPTPKFTAGW